MSKSTEKWLFTALLYLHAWIGILVPRSSKSWILLVYGEIDTAVLASILMLVRKENARKAGSNANHPKPPRCINRFLEHSHFTSDS